MRRGLVLAGLIAVLSAVLALAPPAASAPSGSGSVNPTSGPAGSTFNASGDFTCNDSTMTISLKNGATTRTSSVVSDGPFNTNLTVPPGNPPETDDVTVTCDSTTTPFATFTVTAPPTTTTTTTTTPPTTATTTPGATTTTTAPTTTTTAPPEAAPEAPAAEAVAATPRLTG